MEPRIRTSIAFIKSNNQARCVIGFNQINNFSQKIIKNAF